MPCFGKINLKEKPRMTAADSQLSMGSGEGLCVVDPTTYRGRRLQIIQMTFFPLLPGIALLLYLIVGVVYASNTLIAAVTLTQDITDTSYVTEVMHALQAESDIVIFYRATNGSSLLGLPDPAYARTEDVIQQTPIWPHDQILLTNSPAGLINDLRQHRVALEIHSKPVYLNEVNYYKNLTEAIVDWVTSPINLATVESSWKPLSAYHTLLYVQIDVAVERILGSLFFVNGGLTLQEYAMYSRTSRLRQSRITRAGSYFKELGDKYNEWKNKNKFFMDGLKTFTDTVKNKQATQADAAAGASFHKRMGYYVTIIADLTEDTLQQAKAALTRAQTEAAKTLSYSVVIIVIILGVIMPFVVHMAVGTTANLHAYSNVMEKKSKELRKERRKTETLLNTMLPKSVSYRLKQGEKVGAESFQEVTVMFSDVADFTDISMHSEPLQIVTFLNELYNFIDIQLEKYDVYKVETISSTYMMVSGLPLRNGDRHISEIARLSLDLMTETETFTVPHMPDCMLQLRIGLHTGPCVAGVVGNKMPRYCLFGDTVNTASRMQSNGLPRKIHMSETSYMALCKTGGFNTLPRGVISIKGKGEMQTYWLESRNRVSLAPSDSSQISRNDQYSQADLE